MKAKTIFYLTLLAIVAACSGKDGQESLPPAGATALQFVTFAAGNTKDYQVYVFREAENDFLYYKTLAINSAANGKLTTELPLGNYKFLFTHCPGIHTLLSPTLEATTRFSELSFTNRPVSGSSTLYEPADELFLPAAHTDSIYRIREAMTIRDTLVRAVSQVLLYVKRGQKTGSNEYIPIAYDNDRNILEALKDIRLELEQTGTSMNAKAETQGQGTITYSFDVSAPDAITDEGFAAFTGPFFFPAENNGAVKANITLTPADGEAQPVLTTSATGMPSRNQQLIITVWITSDWKFVGVSTDLQPIEQETPGEQDIWDDNIQ